jgi:hypothetical protein
MQSKMYVKKHRDAFPNIESMMDGRIVYVVKMKICLSIIKAYAMEFVNIDSNVQLKSQHACLHPDWELSRVTVQIAMIYI